jgi:hypothetical protein
MDREIHNCNGRSVIDLLQELYPNGFGSGIRFFVNSVEWPIDDLDYEPKEDDVVLLLVSPQFEILITALITAFVSAAVSYLINLLFAEKPTTPEFADVADPNPAYSVSNKQNAARLGQTIPVVYGEVVFPPDLAASPYSFYDLIDNVAVPGVNITAAFTERTDRANAMTQYGGPKLPTGTGTYPVMGSGWIVVSSSYQKLLFVDDQNQAQTETISVFSTTQVWLNGVKQNSSGFVRGTLVKTWSIKTSKVGSYDGQTTRFSLYNTYRPDASADLSKNDQYLDQLFCLGQGDVDVTELKLGDTPISQLPAGTWQYHVVKPEVHQGVLGNISPLFTLKPERRFHENMVVSAAVNNLRMDDAIELGWYVVSEAQSVGGTLFFDIELPTGLYTLNSSTGALNARTIQFEFKVQQIDANLKPVGNIFTFAKTITAQTNEAIRVSYAVQPGGVSNWRVKMRRITPKGTNTQIDLIVWQGCRMERELSLSRIIYENCTLLALRIRANEMISATSSTRVTVRARRKIKVPGQSTLQFTKNPAYILYDAYTNVLYGAGKTESEIDMPTLNAAAAGWAASPGFNGVFTGRVSMYEAMKTILQPVVARPLLDGQQLSIVHDGVKPIRTAMFSEGNMVENSFSLSYTFDDYTEADGVEVEYRDPSTFDPAYVRTPEDSVIPETINLFGCSDKTQAQEFADLYWERKAYQRLLVQFKTELEGHIPRLGDRIGVQHALPNWGQGGNVVGLNGLQVMFDKALDWSGTNHYVLFKGDKGQPIGPYAITRGATDYIGILPTPLPVVGVGQGVEPTTYAFGKLSTFFKDFIVTKVEHVEGIQVAITGLNYDERVFAKASPFLRGAF